VEPLTNAERVELQRLERTIGSGLASFVEVGLALSDINASRLYREEDGTFDEYCERRWDISRQHGYRLINASQCYEQLRAGNPKGRLPSNESQLRPLVDQLESSEWVQAWEQAVADCNGERLTADRVEKVARKLGGSSKPRKRPIRKKAKTVVSNETVEEIVEVANDALRQKEPTIEQLRSILEDIRDRLNRLVTGEAS
jgi:hypothetical protein